MSREGYTELYIRLHMAGVVHEVGWKGRDTVELYGNTASIWLYIMATIHICLGFIADTCQRICITCCTHTHTHVYGVSLLSSCYNDAEGQKLDE